MSLIWVHSWRGPLLGLSPARVSDSSLFPQRSLNHTWTHRVLTPQQGTNSQDSHLPLALQLLAALKAAGAPVRDAAPLAGFYFLFSKSPLIVSWIFLLQPLYNRLQLSSKLHRPQTPETPKHQLPPDLHTHDWVILPSRGSHHMWFFCIIS